MLIVCFREHELQKHEQMSLLNSLNVKISELEICLTMKDSDINFMEKKVKRKDERIVHQTAEIEKISLLVQNITKSAEERINDKQKELEEKNKEIHNLLLDLQNNVHRNPKCGLCSLDLQIKDDSSVSSGNASMDQYLREINTKVLEKSKQYSILSEKLDNVYKMMHTISRSSFDLMQNKVNDKERRIRQMKETYESQLMMFEDNLIAEQSKCQLVLKAKVQSLNNKIIGNLKLHGKQILLF
jgi:hypothetical protein